MATKHFCDACGEEIGPPPALSEKPWLTLPIANGLQVVIRAARTDQEPGTKIVCAKCMYGALERHLLERAVRAGG